MVRLSLALTHPRKSEIRLAGCAVLVLLLIVCYHQFAGDHDRNMIFESNTDSLQERHPPPRVQKGDKIYSKEDWDSGSPFVWEEYKLVFFTIDTAESTRFKKLLRRMMGFPDWNVLHGGSKRRPWNRKTTNDLKHLYDFSRDRATEMMTSPSWTRAMFVRDPKERFLSAYLNKAARLESRFMRRCCRASGKCVQTARESLHGFFSVVRVCDDAHWRPQSQRVDERFWPFIDFVGHTENIAEDTERLLKQIGAWDQLRKQGWHENGDIFSEHFIITRSKLPTFMTPELETEVDEFYAADYAHPILGLEKVIVFGSSSERHNATH